MASMTTIITLSLHPGTSPVRALLPSAAIGGLSMLLVSMAGCGPAADAQPGGGGPPQAMPVAVVAAKIGRAHV